MFQVITSFRSKGLRQFYETGTKAGIQPKHDTRLHEMLQRLDYAAHPLDMNVDGWDLHALTPTHTGRWSAKVNGNWRVTFDFDIRDGTASAVDYEDYH